MMGLRLVILMLVTFLSVGLVNCGNDDDYTAAYENNSLNGTWNLRSYGGGFSGQFTGYEKGDISWRFDTINNTVTIRSKLDYFGPNSGVYPYEIQEIDEDTVLFLNDSTQGRIHVNEDELLYDHGLIASFKR